MSFASFSRRKPTQFVAFWSLLLVCALLFVPRIWNLRMLYLEPAVRAQAEKGIRAAANREGWILSDIRIASVSGGAVTLVHRRHVRGPDQAVCHRLLLSSGILSPCDAD